MKFSSYLNTDYIFPNLEASSKEEIIRKIVSKVAEDDRVVGEQKDEIIKNILKREEEISTCIGGGIFLPHTRMIDFSDFIIAVATVKNKIISLHISSKMSGTQQVAKVAREMLKREKDIIIVDSKSVTFGQAYQVLEAAKMIKAGAKLEDILTRLYEIADKMKVYFAVSDLTYLEKGGRIGRASSVIGNLLKLRPVLKLEDGEVSLETKTFGERGAISYMEKIIKNEGKNSIYLYTAWGGTNQELESIDILKKTADTMRKIEYKGRFEIGATIGSHSGPVFGIGIISKIR